jgi:predicted transcriptional regulator
MHIELPDEIVQRVKHRAAAGGTEADVIRKGLGALDSQDSELAAIQEGIDAMNKSRVQDFEQFDREFRESNGIAPDA